jgi:hypothetical protein
MLPRCVDEGNMSSMKVAHGRNETDAEPGTLPVTDLLTYVSDGMDDIHKHSGIPKEETLSLLMRRECAEATEVAPRAGPMWLEAVLGGWK